MEDRRWKSYIIRNTTILVLVLYVSSCKSVKTTDELKQHFTKSQIQDLNKIKDFFISEILEGNINDFSSSFKNYFKRTYGDGEDLIPKSFDFKEQIKLYQFISKSTFDEVWEVKINKFKRLNGEEYILPKYKGKFQLYLKHLSQTNLLAKNCWKHMEASGDFNLTDIIIPISKNYYHMDFNDFNNQIIIAVYYLSMVDDMERDPRIKKRLEEMRKGKTFLESDKN